MQQLYAAVTSEIEKARSGRAEDARMRYFEILRGKRDSLAVKASSLVATHSRFFPHNDGAVRGGIPLDG